MRHCIMATAHTKQIGFSAFRFINQSMVYTAFPLRHFLCHTVSLSHPSKVLSRCLLSCFPIHFLFSFGHFHHMPLVHDIYASSAYPSSLTLSPALHHHLYHPTKSGLGLAEIRSDTPRNRAALAQQLHSRADDTSPPTQLHISMLSYVYDSIRILRYPWNVFGHQFRNSISPRWGILSCQSFYPFFSQPCLWSVSWSQAGCCS